MINQADRLSLRQKPDFFQTSQKYFTRPLTFFYQQESGGVAIIIPKKYYRLSTTRHALKRQVASVLQPFLGRLKNTSVALVATDQLCTLSRSELDNEVKRFLHHLNLL